MENIMLKDSRKKHIKIIDFGLSNLSTGENNLETHCGSPEYAAPELFIVGQKYGPEVDLWSLGVILYGMVIGQLPFLSLRNEKTSMEEWRRKLMTQIFRGLTTLQEKKISTISKDYKNLVRRLLEPAAHRRIPMGEICRHPWLDDGRKNVTDHFANFPSKKTLKSDVIQAIFQEMNAITRLNYSTINEKIGLKPYGEIGGMFNIKAHKLLGTGSADVFEPSSSSIAQKIRTVGRLLSRESSSTGISSLKPTSLSNNSSIRRSTIHNDNHSEIPILKTARRKEASSKKSSSTCNSIASSNFTMKNRNSASEVSQKKEQKSRKTNRDESDGRKVIKSIGNSSWISGQSTKQPHLHENSARQFSSSSTKTTNYSRFRPFCHGGSSIVPRDESCYGRLQRWLDNKDKTYRQQRYSAPDVIATCNNGHANKNSSATRVNRIGRIAIPSVSTSSWRNSRLMTHETEKNELHSCKIFGNSANERYGMEKFMKNPRTSRQMLERGKIISQTTRTVNVQKCADSTANGTTKNCAISSDLRDKK